MKVFKCKFENIFTEFGNNDLRLLVIMIDNHDLLGGRSGEHMITSKLKLIDFERKFAITQNNIYDWS